MVDSTGVKSVPSRKGSQAHHATRAGDHIGIMNVQTGKAAMDVVDPTCLKIAPIKALGLLDQISQ